MTRRALALLVLLGAFTCLAACTDRAGQPKRHAGTKEDPWLVGMSQCNRGEPWRVQMDADLEKAAASLAGRMRVVFKDAQNDASAQRAQIEELVQQGIDLLILSPKETGPLDKVVKDAYERGIPVLVLDRRLGHQSYTAFIGGDNEKIGRAAGEWCRQALGGKGVVVELKGLMTSSPAQDRHRGFRQGLDLVSHPEIRIGYEGEMRWLEPEARKEMESALSKLAKIDLVYAHNDPGAHGAWLAAKAAGRQTEMKFVGIDALPHEGVDYVRQRILDATFLYPTGGAEAIAMAVAILEGKSVPRETILGTRVFDAATLDGREIK